jgi:hypothetical protein
MNSSRSSSVTKLTESIPTCPHRGLPARCATSGRATRRRSYSPRCSTTAVIPLANCGALPRALGARTRLRRGQDRDARPRGRAEQPVSAWRGAGDLGAGPRLQPVRAEMENIADEAGVRPPASASSPRSTSCVFSGSSLHVLRRAVSSTARQAPPRYLPIHPARTSLDTDLSQSRQDQDEQLPAQAPARGGGLN